MTKPNFTFLFADTHFHVPTSMPCTFHLSVLKNLGTLLPEYLQPQRLYLSLLCVTLTEECKVSYPYYFTATNSAHFFYFLRFLNIAYSAVFSQFLTSAEIPPNHQDLCHFPLVAEADPDVVCIASAGWLSCYWVTVPASEPAALSSCWCGGGG